MKIIEALEKLDPTNDDHWTDDGSPRVDVVSKIFGSKLARQEITNTSPSFTRGNFGLAASKPIGGIEEGDEQIVVTAPTPGEPGYQQPTPTPVNPDGSPYHPNLETKRTDQVKAKPLNISVPDPQPQGELEILEAKLERLTADMLEAQREVTRSKVAADDLANQVNTINRQLDRWMKRDPNYNTRCIRAYIEQQNQNRIDRGRRLRAFVDQTKVHPVDLARATNPKSPIDMAMAGRKPPRGTLRPSLPLKK